MATNRDGLYAKDSSGNPIGLVGPVGGVIATYSGNAGSGDTTGVTDTVAFVTMINQINSAGHAIVQIPPGKFYVKGSQLPAITVPCTIQGAGSGTLEKVISTDTGSDNWATQIINVENSTPVWVVNSDSVNIRNMRISYSGTTAPTYPAINVGGAGSTAICHKRGMRCVYESLAIDNFSIGIDMWGTAYSHIRGNWISGSAWIGIRINNIRNNDANDLFVTNNVITHSSWGSPSLAAIYWMSGGGLICTGNKINQNINPGNGTGLAKSFYGIRVKQISIGAHGPDGVIWALPGGNTSDIQIANNSIENTLGAGVIVEQTGATGPTNIKITSNQFLAVGNIATNDGYITAPDAQGTGFVVGDVLTMIGGTGTKATFVVTDVNASGAIMDWNPVQFGTFTVLPSSLGGTRGSPTGGSGTIGASFFYEGPIYNIAVLGFASIPNVVISDNVSTGYSGGVIVGGVSSGHIGINTWKGNASASTTILSAVFLDRFGLSAAIGVSVEPQNYVGNYLLPQASNSWLYGSANSSDADGVYSSWRNLARHAYSHSMKQVANNVSVAMFTIELVRYSTCTFEVTVGGYLTGVNGSFGGKFKRLASMEAVNTTPVLTVLDTDTAQISGVSKTVTLTSNIAKIDSGATDEVDIGIVPQAGTNKIWIYVIAPVGASAITNISGLVTLNIQGNVQKVGVGNI